MGITIFKIFNKDTRYKTFVMPQVEYAATVCDPHTTENIKRVEAVQWRAARFVTGDYRYTSSVTAMTESLLWETLQHKRQQDNAIMMFRIVHVSLSTTSTIGCCFKRPPDQVKNPILQDQYIQRAILPVKYQTVEPAARKADKC